VSRYSESDPYLDPSTGILRNLLGCTDQDSLDRAEGDFVTVRLIEIAQQPIKGDFGITHLQSIHRQLFSDVYDWAGQFRTVGIARGSSTFCAPAHIASYTADLLHKLAQENYLANLPLPQFAQRAAFFLGELNAVHPFREGNGRAQREFIRQAGSKAGFEISWVKISRQQMTYASIASYNGDLGPLTALLMANISRRDQAGP
jgi:fido (protein-threonine AMPylation protein)